MLKVDAGTSLQRALENPHPIKKGTVKDGTVLKYGVFVTNCCLSLAVICLKCARQ